MQRFTLARDLPADAPTVIEQVCSEAYLLFRYQDPNQLDFELEVLSDTPQEHRCRVLRVYGSEKIPAVARRILGQRIEVQQTQRWSRQGPVFAGEMRLEVLGVPGHIETSMRLADTQPGHCQMTAEGGIDVKVPLIGRQIEKMLLERSQEGFATSMQAIQDWLRQQGLSQ